VCGLGESLTRCICYVGCRCVVWSHTLDIPSKPALHGLPPQYDLGHTVGSILPENHPSMGQFIEHCDPSPSPWTHDGGRIVLVSHILIATPCVLRGRHNNIWGPPSTHPQPMQPHPPPHSASPHAIGNPTPPSVTPPGHPRGTGASWVTPFQPGPPPPWSV